VKTIPIKVPDWVDEKELKMVVKNYLASKRALEEFYSLMDEVDFDELEKEVREFRKSFKLGNNDLYLRFDTFLKRKKREELLVTAYPS